jgi:hypothetical protein
VGKKRPGRKIGNDRYTLPQVAMLMMSAAELYQRVTAPSAVQMSDLYGKPNRSPQEEKVGEVHAEIVRQMNFGGDGETVLIGLIDLDQAMKRMAFGIKVGIADFVRWGPRDITADDVIFRRGHAHAVVSVWKAMNGETEAKTDAQRANARMGIKKMEAA